MVVVLFSVWIGFYIFIYLLLLLLLLPIGHIWNEIQLFYILFFLWYFRNNIKKHYLLKVKFIFKVVFFIFVLVKLKLIALSLLFSLMLSVMVLYMLLPAGVVANITGCSIITSTLLLPPLPHYHYSFISIFFNYIILPVSYIYIIYIYI